MITHIISLLWLQTELKDSRKFIFPFNKLYLRQSPFLCLSKQVYYWRFIYWSFNSQTHWPISSKPLRAASVNSLSCWGTCGERGWFIFISKAWQVSHLGWHPLELYVFVEKSSRSHSFQSCSLRSKRWFPLEISDLVFRSSSLAFSSVENL